MRITADRLAVAEAVLDYIMEINRVPAGYADIDRIIEAIPEPEPDVQHHAAPTCDSLDERWMRFQNLLWDAINRYAVACGGDPSDRVYGNTVRQMSVVAVNTAVREFVRQPDTTKPEPDVQAQDCVREVFDATRQLCRDIIIDVGPEDDGTRDEMLTRLDEMQKLWPLSEAVTVQAQIDALQAEVDRWRNTAANQMIQEAVAKEREAQSIDAAAFRLLRDEADAADAWHAETGMKVARPPRMSPATVKHIRDAEIRARGGAKGE